MPADVMPARWYPQADDTIGGWCVMTVDKPPSQCDHRKGEWQAASFMDEIAARHIADVHNAWLDAGGQ